MIPLALELILGIAASVVLGGLVSFGPVALFRAAIGAALVLAIPCLAAVLLAGPRYGTPALALLLLPLIATGLRRVRPSRLRTARRLGGGYGLILRLLILPVLAPFLIAALLTGSAVLGAKARLERRPAGTIELQDPPTGFG